jgi:hypothetical protein
MARENFLWGAPRIHGELLMLGFTVSQATVSRYMPPANRRPGQSWRTFIRNQILAFRHDNDSEDESARNDAGLGSGFYRGMLVHFLTPVADVRVAYDYGPSARSKCSTNCSEVRAGPSRCVASGTATVGSVRPLMANRQRLWSGCRTPDAQSTVSCSASLALRLPPTGAVRSGDFSEPLSRVKQSVTR